MSLMGWFDRPLRARNSLIVGLVGTAVLVGAVAAVIILPRVSFLSSNRGYSANFAQAAGITSGDDVRVAGIPVGTVTSVKLNGDVITVGFDVSKGTHLGSRTTASIEVATLLGTKFIGLTPAGPGSLSTATPIPLSRTTVPFDLADVTNHLSATVSGLDIPRIRAALRAVSTTFAHTPSATRAALRGLSGIAKVITDRQSQFSDLLVATKEVTATLAAQRGTLDRLFLDADNVLQTVRERRAVIHQLLTDSATLGSELTRLVNHNSSTLGPLLTRLHVVTQVLRENDHLLAHSIDLLAPASRGLANATGDGRYIDVNLPYLFISDNVLCAFSIATGCR
jgi:phospholipid/cholesterol/gamma-HCH transport system substrate-binding protein